MTHQYNNDVTARIPTKHADRLLSWPEGSHALASPVVYGARTSVTIRFPDSKAAARFRVAAQIAWQPFF